MKGITKKKAPVVIKKFRGAGFHFFLWINKHSGSVIAATFIKFQDINGWGFVFDETLLKFLIVRNLTTMERFCYVLEWWIVNKTKCLQNIFLSNMFRWCSGSVIEKNYSLFLEMKTELRAQWFQFTSWDVGNSLIWLSAALWEKRWTAARAGAIRSGGNKTKINLAAPEWNALLRRESVMVRPWLLSLFCTDERERLVYSAQTLT
jgi:hypothetical protein